MIYRSLTRILCLLFVIGCCVSTRGTAQASASSLAAETRKQDETEILKIFAEGALWERSAADLDWENAFGVRFHNMKDLRAFVETRVMKLSTAATTNDQLETKINFIGPAIAVVDVYSHLVGQIDANTGKPGADRWIRNTYVLTKSDRQWTIALQRIADLRSPWYRHLTALPAAVPVPAATLASYAGIYEARPDLIYEVSPEGDHLTVKTQGGAGIAIPQSNNEFLYFRDPAVPGNHRFLTFSKSSDGGVTFTEAGRANDHPILFTKR
jgi:hypothetical protein